MAAPGSTARAVAAPSRHDDVVLLAEVEETDAAYLLELLPDVQKEGVDLLISGRCLTVTGWTVQGGGAAAIAARRAFRYEVLLPYDVDTGSVAGSFRGGALRVRAGKLRARHAHGGFGCSDGPSRGLASVNACLSLLRTYAFTPFERDCAQSEGNDDVRGS